MRELKSISRFISRWLQSEFLTERTPDEIADALLIQTEGRTMEAVTLGESYLRRESNPLYLVEQINCLMQRNV